MKLFPALLFIFVLKQKRFRVFWIMLLVLLIAWLVPLLVFGITVYQHYFSMVSSTLFSGDSWNASIYGFIHRVFYWNGTKHLQALILPAYILLFVISLSWYVVKLGPNEKKPINHQPFCLTVGMMIFLSPLGWVYYFPALLLPLLLTCFFVFQEKNGVTIFIWFLCFFLINFPLLTGP